MNPLLALAFAATALTGCAPHYLPVYGVPVYGVPALGTPVHQSANYSAWGELRDGVIPPQDYSVTFPKDDAFEAYSLASYIAKSCPRYGVDETKLFRFFKTYDLRPGDVQPDGAAYDGFRDGYDLFDFQSRVHGIGNQSCGVADRLHAQNLSNPGWILSAG